MHQLVFTMTHFTFNIYDYVYHTRKYIISTKVNDTIVVTITAITYDVYENFIYDRLTGYQLDNYISSNFFRCTYF